MLRTVVVYQLILSLVVGPMLCCCSLARLGHESGSATANARSCCGVAKQSPSDESSNSHREFPGNKPQCPCKSDPVKAVDVATSTTVTELVSVSSDHPLPLFSHDDGCHLAVDGTIAAHNRHEYTSFTSTAKLLYAHHNLRC